jgi:acetyl esterase/lipase
LSAVWIINDEPREDKRDHSILAEQLARHTGFPVAVPNYRLTPQEKTEDNILRHPSHAEDILQFLEFLLTWEGPSGYTGIFDPTQLFLMGHSCSTHILSSILLDSSAVTPTLTPSAALLCAIKGVVMCEGIYDLDLLNANFPDYLEWFVAPAFGKRDSYALFATTSYPCVTFDFNWLLIHSQGDTLIDFSQSEKMVEHLKSEYGPAADRQVSYNTSMTQGHDEILVTDDFVSIVGRFVKGE